MNTTQGIDEIVYGTDDLAACRQFFLDWGLASQSGDASGPPFETFNDCRVRAKRSDDATLPAAMEAGSTLREVIWGTDPQAVLDRLVDKLADRPGYVHVDGRVGCTDPNDLAVCVQLTTKRDVGVQCVAMNTWIDKPRRNQPSPIYERVAPIEVGHVVFSIKDVVATGRFYIDRLGFISSDHYPGRGALLRCESGGGHHDLFPLQTSQAKSGLNHVTFIVRDIHEVFGGGMYASRCGWETQLGSGRHPISSVYFWYFKDPVGGLIEYYADEDQLDANWQPRDFELNPTVFVEWAIDGGIDGNIRRQRNVVSPEGKFLTEKR